MLPEREEIAMSLIDDVRNKVMGGQGGGGSSITACVHLLDSYPGGFSGLLQAFHERGLGGVVSSWVSTGENQQVSAEQIQSVLGNEKVKQFAAKAGIDPEQASQKIAECLPMVVDKLTPNGEVPQGSLLDRGKDLLKGLGGKAA
jgi:uncharacterized protein YidB (DUF937 family)